jgi:hypothetical protein
MRPLLQSPPAPHGAGRCAPPGPRGCARQTRGDARARPASTADVPAPKPAGRPGRWPGSPDRWRACCVARHACAPAGKPAANSRSGLGSGGAVETAGRSRDSRTRGSSLPPISRMPRGGSVPACPGTGRAGGDFFVSAVPYTPGGGTDFLAEGGSIRISVEARAATSPIVGCGRYWTRSWLTP